MEKQFIQIQLALFFKNDFQGILENVSLFIKEQFGSGMTTQILGIPANAPSGIPRLTANSSLVDINLSKNRIDFFSKSEHFTSDHFEKIFNIINEISVEIGRVGVVLTYFKEAEINELKSIFDQSKLSNLNPKDITVRLNEEITINGVVSNNSQMYVSGFGDDGRGGKKRGIINTLQENINTNKFDKETLNKFITDSIVKASESLI